MKRNTKPKVKNNNTDDDVALFPRKIRILIIIAFIIVIAAIIYTVGWTLNQITNPPQITSTVQTQ